MLHLYRPVPMITAPRGHSRHRPAQTPSCCPDVDRKLPIATPRTDVREAQEDEGRRLRLAARKCKNSEIANSGLPAVILCSGGPTEVRSPR